MHILRFYILRLHLVPLILGFGVVTFILEMDVLFDYLDLVVNRGVAPGVVAQLFVLSLGYIVALSVPCAVLVAVLMTFGRLSQDNEITALRAGGVNLAGVLLAPLAAAAVLTVGLTLFNNHVLPASNHAFANLLIDIGKMRPTVKLQEGVFIGDFPGYNLLVQSVNGRTNEMRGVTIYQTTPSWPTGVTFPTPGTERPRSSSSRTERFTRSRTTSPARGNTGGWCSRPMSFTSPAPAGSSNGPSATRAPIGK
jgi:lipopolysaccharide export system permease protein